MKEPKKMSKSDGILQIEEWQEVTMRGRDAYLVAAKGGDLGMLFVDGDPEQTGGSIIAHMVGQDAKDCRSYRGEDIQIPIEFQKAIASARLRSIVKRLMYELLGDTGSDNPALRVVAWCDLLQKKYCGTTMKYLFLDLAEADGEGIEQEEWVEQLKQINAECERLWPERVERDEDI